MAESHKATTINHFSEKLLKIKVCVRAPADVNLSAGVVAIDGACFRGAVA